MMVLLALGFFSASSLLVWWVDFHLYGNFVTSLLLAVMLVSHSAVLGVAVCGVVHLLICLVLAYELWPSEAEKAKRVRYRWRFLTLTAIYIAYTALLAFVPGFSIKM